MTIVELYTDHPPDNIVSTLALHPERIIFIGENKEITRTKAFYQRFFETIGRHTAVETAAVNPHDLTAIVRVLSRIVETEPDCVFDLTGGNDLVLIAMGMVYERYRDKGTVRMHRFNTRTGTARDVIDNTALTADKPQLTVAQAVQLYGGVVGGSTDGGQMTDWEFTPSFKRALDTMWSVCRQDPSLWNSAVTAMQEYISGTTLGGDTLCVLPDTADTQKSYRRACTLVRALEEKGVVTTEPCCQGRRVICPDAQVRRCLAKAGNLLEVRILAIVRGLQGDNGEAVFCDSRNSVYIDWDGAFGAHDTVNEMDVMAMLLRCWRRHISIQTRTHVHT